MKPFKRNINKKDLKEWN